MKDDAANMVILAPNDNVGIALRDIACGSLARTVSGVAMVAQEAIAQGHKMALGDIAQGALILRFDVPVAIATMPIAQGHLVHVHNVASRYLTNSEDHYE
ncbi:UxaA family hydrolase [Methylovirgula sp. 4M-Z18]|uniref:UxaA family hydrolase n=1 Tax=Methylovirgula sp. 4M-Z18 TaxID=2293567 RepID=UPI000E2E9F4F|nr:UxaA family hydrolase [Methylovirgula sp. 4M-Z18]RFB79345.1 hypothetical protein DYH55_12375 [Methylovirgula sp. 4M-Z18]